MEGRSYLVSIAQPGKSLDCGAAAVSTTIPNRRDGTRSKWVLVSPLLDDHSYQFINTGEPDVDELTGLRSKNTGGPIAYNVGGFEFISHRSVSGADVEDAIRIYAIEDI